MGRMTATTIEVPADVDLAVTDPWPARASCLTRPGGVDHAQLTPDALAHAETHDGWYIAETVASGRKLRNWSNDLGVAQSTCYRCPVLDECTVTALVLVDVAGVAGALTEAERAQWRADRGLAAATMATTTVDADIAAGIPPTIAWEGWAADQAAGIARRAGGVLPDVVRAAIEQLDALGWSSTRIADAFPPGVRVTAKTVQHVLRSSRAEAAS